MLTTPIPPRLASADLLKAVSIIAVVFIHAALAFPFTPFPMERAVHLGSAFYTQYIIPSLRFCVPVFIILWAYFAAKSLNRQNSASAYLANRFYKLLIPFLFWSLIYFIIAVDFHKITFTSAITKNWSGYGWSGQYYFIILFQLIPLFVFTRYISRFAERNFVIFLVLAVIFYTVIGHYAWFGTGIISKLSDRPFIYWMPYVIFGVAYANKGKNLKNPLSTPASVAVGVVVVLLIPLESIVSKYTGLPLSDLSVYIKPSVFIASVTLVYLALGKTITYQQLAPWLSNCVGTLARNTLGIFCLNPLVVLAIYYAVHTSHSYFYFPGCSIIIPLFSVALVIIICITIINFLKRLKLGIIIAN